MKPGSIILLCFLFCICISTPTQGKTVLILIDGLSLEDVWATRGLELWVEQGAIGLMNVRTFGRTTPGSSHLSIGSGSRARGGNSHGWAFNTQGHFGEIPVDLVYAAWTGLEAPHESIVNLGISEITELNKNLGYKVIPGFLGSALHQKGKRTWIIGNSDTSDAFRRFGSLIAMDEQGTIWGGEVSRNLLIWDENWPLGWRTNYEVLWDYWELGYEQGDFIVVELGDLSRLEVNRQLLSPQRQRELRTTALGRISYFLLQLWDSLKNDHANVFIISPTPVHWQLQKGHLMTPLISYIPGQSGLLVSDTTRRAGIVTNLDVAPTIVQLMDLETSILLTGSSLETKEQNRPLEYLTKLWQDLVKVYDQRLPILQNYVIMQITVYLIFLLLIWLGIFRYLLVYKWVLLTIMAVPFILLLFPTQTSLGLTAAWLVFLAAALGLILALVFPQDFPMAFIILAALIVLAIAVDILLGSSKMANSLLGYDPIVGARFYGIGNEYMGVFLSSLLVAITGLWEACPRIKAWASLGTLLISFLAIFLLVGSTLGANVGGTMAAVVGLGWTWWRLSGRKFTWVAVLVIFFSLLVILAGAFAYDYVLCADKPSHLGRTAGLIYTDGPAALFGIARRKILLNLRLMRYTYWTRILITSLGILFLFSLKPAPLVKEIQKNYPYLAIGLRGSVITGLAALFFNDSGVVAASTALIPVMPIILYLAMLHGNMET